MIPIGTFKARGCEAALGYTNNGSEQVAIDFVLLEGESEGAHITWYGYFTEKTTEHTLAALRTCGWQTDDLSDLTGCDANDVYLVIEHEDDLEGNPRARVRFINGSGGVQLKTRMDEGNAKAFAERMKGHVLAAKQRSPGVPAATSTRTAPANGTGNAPRGRGTGPASTTRSDDDIPY